jgi:hypothetical protein
MSSNSITGPRESSLPRLFAPVGERRSLWVLAVLTLVSGAAMLPAMGTMSDHGASVVAFEFAGSVGRSQEILAEWGSAGKAAAWWQLALDTPFLIGYGFLLAGACVVVARRAKRAGLLGLQQTATKIAWFGPLAAGADLLQNISLGLILAGHETQPWPGIAAVCGVITLVLMAIGVVFVSIGLFRTRASA